MRPFRSFFTLVSIEALIFLLWAFFSPLDSSVVVFLWFSRTRILLLISLLGISLASLGILLWSWRAPTGVHSLLIRLDRWCIEQHKLGSTIVILVLGPILFLTAVLAVNSIPMDSESYPSWAPVTFPIVYALAHRFLLVWLLAGLISIQFAIFLVIRYHETAIARETWSWSVLEPGCIAFLIATVLLFHWGILLLQLRFFVNIPAWYWVIDVKPFTLRDLGFAVVVVWMLMLAYWLLISLGHVKRGLLMVFLLGCILQFGIGFISASGMFSLRERYFSSYHSAYPLRASQNHLPILETIRGYEETYAQLQFTNTKPPGLMVFYILLERLVNGQSAKDSDVAHFERLSWAITYGFPILAMFMVYLLYAFAKRFLNHSTQLLPRTAPILYVFCPNIILFSLFTDQAIYPILFLLSVWLIIFTIQRGSFLWSFILGVVLYAAVFFAFTMLPLYLITAIYLGLDYWMNRQKRHIRRTIGTALGIAAGTALLYAAFLLYLDYDFFPRFEKTVQINHDFDFYTRVGVQPPDASETLPTRIQQIGNAAWVNNLDFAAAIGFPVYILFVIQGIRLIINFFKNNLKPGELILLALLLSFVALNLAGTAQGEVARLWIFWVPMVILLAALEIEKWVQYKRALVLVLALTGFLTILLTYHFQDLLM